MADRISGIENRLTVVEKQVAEVYSYVTGARKVWGIAARNWRKALIFGCGVITSAGLGNPQVQSVAKYIAGFFG